MTPDLTLETQLDLALRLTVGLVLGAIIGLERELQRQPAGFRTHSLVSLGAALFTVVSAFGFSGDLVDPTRIAAQIVSGIGFIGAGTILHMRGSVTGLTSAATIWVVAAIGMSVGARAYIEALGTTLVVMLVLAGLGPAEHFLARQAARGHLIIHCRPEASAVDELEALVRRTGLEIDRTQSRVENVDLVVEFDIRGAKRLHDQLLIAVVHQPGVRSISTGE